MPVSRLGDHPRLAADVAGRFGGRRDRVQRPVEEREPLLEMLLCDRRDREMLHHRVAGEIAGAEQDRLPEAVHLAEMRGPVGNLRVEDRAQHRILAHRGIEAIDQIGDEGSSIPIASASARRSSRAAIACGWACTVLVAMARSKS